MKEKKLRERIKKERKGRERTTKDDPPFCDGGCSEWNSLLLEEKVTSLFLTFPYYK